MMLWCVQRGLYDAVNKAYKDFTTLKTKSLAKVLNKAHEDSTTLKTVSSQDIE